MNNMDFAGKILLLSMKLAIWVIIKINSFFEIWLSSGLDFLPIRATIKLLLSPIVPYVQELRLEMWMCQSMADTVYTYIHPFQDLLERGLSLAHQREALSVDDVLCPLLRAYPLRHKVRLKTTKLVNSREQHAKLIIKP